MKTKREIAAAMVVATLAIAAASPSWAAAVVTVSGRQEGAVVLKQGAVQVGATSIPWADVMQVVSDAAVSTPKSAQIVRMKNGEVLVGAIQGIAKGSITLDSPLFGTQTIDLTRVSSIEFVANLPPLTNGKKNSLYRNPGNPISGRLLWLKGDRLAIDASIGAMELKMAGIERFVFESGLSSAPALNVDEVQLADGSIVRGAVEPTAEGIAFESETLGKHRFGPAAWSSLRRFSGKAIYLADLTPTKTETFPFLLRPADAPRRESTSPGANGIANRLTISPKTRISYKTPDSQGGKYVFKGSAHLPQGVRGGARLEIRVDGEPRLEQRLQPYTTQSEAISVELPSGSRLEILVDFAERVRFPCIVAIDNALLEKK